MGAISLFALGLAVAGVFPWALETIAAPVRTLLDGVVWYLTRHSRSRVTDEDSVRNTLVHCADDCGAGVRRLIRVGQPRLARMGIRAVANRISLGPRLDQQP